MTIKTKIADLSIFGGLPLYDETLHVGRPNIGDRQALLSRINSILDNRWLTNNGPYVQELEAKIASLVGVKHCIAMCNGTVALEIAIRALGMTGEVIVPSMTFIATAHALQWQEITPVFCDIEEKSHHMDPDMVEKMITPRTSGIIGVHLWGQPCDIEALTRISRKHRLKLLFDAAHAFGCCYNGRSIGCFGDAEVFSFHATKFINTFEGGAVTTNDDELAKKIRLMKNFGFSGYDNVVYIGTNGKMSEVSAAMGITSLEAMDGIITVNRDNYGMYRDLLGDLPGMKLISYDKRQNPNYQYIILEVDEDVTAMPRDRLVDILQHENILARKYFFPGCHGMEPYRSYFPHSGLLLPHTQKVLSRVMSLPTGTSVGKEDIERICGLIRFILENALDINARLKNVRR